MWQVLAAVGAAHGVPAGARGAHAGPALQADAGLVRHAEEGPLRRRQGAPRPAAESHL